MAVDFFRLKLVLLLVWATASQAAWGQDPQQEGRSVAKFPESVTMTLLQRQSGTIPNSKGMLTLSIGDVTGQMVLVSISDKRATKIVPETPICIDEKIQFEVENRKHILTLSQLEDRWFGDDSATFTIEQGEVKDHGAAFTSKFGESTKTKVSGELAFQRFSPRGSVEMRLRKREFSLQPGDWCWLSNDEILKVLSASEERVTYRLYQPAPTPGPF